MGGNFKLLGVEFDPKLLIHDAARTAVHECSWKLKTQLRTQRFFTTRELVRNYKAHILSYLEYRTAGISHAASSVLAPVDQIQARFLEALGIPILDALLHFNLAPLATRRDMANLGIIHRAVLGKGPSVIRPFFLLDPSPPRSAHRRHARQLLDPYRDMHRGYLNRSVLGHIVVYNLLPARVVSETSVKSFQSALASFLKDVAVSSFEFWHDLFSSRILFLTHPLRRYG